MLRTRRTVVPLGTVTRVKRFITAASSRESYVTLARDRHRSFLPAESTLDHPPRQFRAGDVSSPVDLLFLSPSSTPRLTSDLRGARHGTLRPGVTPERGLFVLPCAPRR